MEPTPVWLLPNNFNASENEGREAFECGRSIERNPYGESLAGTDWLRGWRQARAGAKSWCTAQ